MPLFFAKAARLVRPFFAFVLLVLVSVTAGAQQPPTALRYPTPNVYIAGASNVFLSPTVSGNITSYSIAPGLPTGLSFNTNTGVISGTPLTASPATTYTVTATNASGTTNTTLSIQVTSSYYNNSNAQISFDSPTPLSGDGRAAGNRVLYSNVATLSGTTIDAIVTTTSYANLTSYDVYDQSAVSGTNFSNNDPKFFSPQLTFNNTASAASPGQIRFDIQFILGGSYNASTNPNGTPVILQNVTVNSYDVDGNGTAGSNQFNLFGGFNTYQLSASPATTVAATYDAATGLTKFRSTVSTNNTNVLADETQIRLSYSNVSSFPLVLGAEEGGQAFFFIDFSTSNAFTTPTTVAVPSIDLNTGTTGVNNEATGCASGLAFTNGSAATNNSTPSTNSFDSLVVRIPTAQLLNGSNELLLVNGATAGSSITLTDGTSTTTTLSGVSYTVTVSSRNGIRFVRFVRAGSTAAQIEALLDALQYRNTAATATNGTRNFTVNAYNAAAQSPDAIFSATLNCVSVSGNIYRDPNGLSDNTVNASSGTQFGASEVFAVLTRQSDNVVVASAGVSAGGAYSFGTQDPGNYYITVRSTNAVVGGTITTPSYPASSGQPYVSVGENIGSGAGSDGLVDGRIVVTLGSSSVANANFGLDVPPTTSGSVLSSIPNPGGYNYYTVPTTGGFTYNDLDGSVASITITSFPTGANVIRLNGVIYTNGGTCPPQSACVAWPGAVVVPVANIAAIAVDPAATGNTSVVIPFRATDNAGVQDVTASASTLTINFIAQASPITVSGNVLDDANGNGIKDAAEQYTNVAGSGQTLYALLVQTSNTYSGAATIYASTPVTAAATGYSFSNVPSGNNYEVRIASLGAAPTDGAALSTITQTLASGWTDVSYNNNGTITTGLNTTSPVISLGTVTSSRTNVTFGLDALPTAVTGAAVNVTNPGATNTVAVPAAAFSGTDADLAAGQISYIHITAFPANATSLTITGALTPGGAVTSTTYTASNFPAGGVFVASNAAGNLASPGSVLVDPVNGAVAVSIPFRVVDNAGMESTNTAAVNLQFSDLTVSGTVYDDANGGTINGTPISNANGQLYMNLVSGGVVVASQALTNGTYSFGTANGVRNDVATYNLVLTNSAAATGSVLPGSAWTYTAEGLTGTAGDGAPNGIYSFGAVVTGNTVVDFGIDARPTTTGITTATTQVNPGGANNVTIPAATFSGTDLVDLNNAGQISYILITTFPNNVTSITLTGALTPGGAVTTTTYTSATFPAGGVYVATNTAGNPATNVLVDPINGAVTVDLAYKVVDNAGKESNNTGIARQPLSDLTLSGNVYDDVNAGTIDGFPISNAGGQLYVNLVNSTTNTLVASKAVSGGAYSFSTADGLMSSVSTYRLVLAASPAATVAGLPNGAWTNTAEGSTGTTGDGTGDGTYSFGGAISTNTVIDFGIDALPTVAPLSTAASQVNPGGTATVTVPASTFSASDATDISGGAVSFFHITSFPTNTTTLNVSNAATSVNGTYGTVSYTVGTFPAGGIYIPTNAAGNPTATITADPVNGAVSVDFTYTAIDNAGKESNTSGTARQPLSDLTITGTVYDDADGATDNLIDGTPVSSAGGQLYVNLINTSNNTVVASQALTNGTYSFGTANGVQNGVTTYALVLTSSAASTTPVLPSSGWVNTGEGLPGTAGDANVNGRYLFGGALTTSQQVDFGIDALPIPATLTTAATQVNPGGTATVSIPASTFSGSDANDVSGGQINYIHIISFPSNSTRVNFASAATTPGGAPGALTYTAASFPAGGVYIATNTAGNPTSAITVDPVNGAVNVDFVYKVIDNALEESNGSGIARQPLGDLSISGKVYDDVNGGVIDGALISNAGGQLYVNLVNASNNTVVASQAIANGSYSFGTADGVLNNVSYRLVLTSSPSANTATLPSAGWVYMAEGVSGTSGDATANGTYNFGGAIITAQQIDFAIEALPVPATLTTATPQVNPGGPTFVTIPASTFMASDANDISGGAVSFIHITAFPANTTTVSFASAATSVGGPFVPLAYNAGNFPTGGVYVATASNGNPLSAITVDPVNGAVNVDLIFTAIDNSGRESLTSGIARQPLTDLAIAGTLYDDANGTLDGIINGTPAGSVGGTQVYVNLVSGGTVLASQALPTAGGTAGTFSFSTTNGIVSGGNYTVVIATTATATASNLPAGWVNTAEGNSNTGDGSANGSVALSNVQTTQTLFFGVNAIPTASSSTITAQNNPGGNALVTIPSASFPGTDPDVNGEIAYVRLTAFPANAVSITVLAATSYGGTATTQTYTSANFPTGGLYIPTDGPGFLLPVDALKVDPANGAVSATFPYTVFDIAGYESNAAVTTVPFVLGAISGTVYNDVDALTDNQIDGVGTSLGGQLYINAVDNLGNVAASAPVQANGTYVIAGLGSATYTLTLTTSAGSSTATLPAGYVNTGEGIGGSIVAPADGQLVVNLSSGGITNADFGFDARPVANSSTAPAQVNPGGTNTITVPAASFSGTDPDAANGGEISYIHITAFPTNVTSITVTAGTTPGGAVTTATYTSGSFPGGGVYIATDASGNPATAILADPVDGANTIAISYRVVDNGGLESTNTATLQQPLSDLVIAGTVYDDANGGTINGMPISNANGQLYVNLVSGGVVVASQALTNGTYSFSTANGVRNDVGNYTLVLTNSATGTTPVLPSSAWANTAEGLSGTSGDGGADGSYSFGGAVTSPAVIDFGIDGKPTAVSATAVTQTNPGGTNNITIPAATFSGTDAVDISGGAISYIHITAIPGNATSITLTGSNALGGPVTTSTYNPGNFPAGGVYVATNTSGNPTTAILVDPLDGAVTVTVPFRVVDNAGVESNNTAVAAQPLSDLLITGTVFDDVDGLTDGRIDGTPISDAGGRLYVNLVDVQSGVVVSSKLLSNGTFSFGTADGLRSDVANYQLVLAASPAATTPGLPAPADWVNIAEGVSGTAGDPVPNGRYVFGGVVTTNRVIDFAIDALPVPAFITTAVTQVNPGGINLVTIPASTFVASDANDISGGVVSFIRIASFPTNATTVNFAAASTTPGGTPGPLSYTSATFPAGGVYVATGSNGNPTSAITVDPVDGAVNVDFAFHAIDNAGQASTITGTARQPLSDLLLTGTVYDDVNGGTIDGTPIASAGGQLYVNLVYNNTVVASKAVTAAQPGFSFSTADGLRNDVSGYQLVLSASPTATTPALPSAQWVNTAEGIPATTGDGTVDGAYTFAGVIAANTQIDFGIDARPVPLPLIVATPKLNPGGNLFIPIASGIPLASDPVDVAGGQVSRLHVISFPTKINAVTVTASTTPNGSLTVQTFTAATFPAGGIYVATDAGGSTLDPFFIDPIDGADTVEISFRAIDQAGVESIATGLGRIPILDITIGGSIYDDVNGANDGVINGTLISNAGGQLYVNLVDGATNTVVASKAVTGGTYSFGTADGLRSDVNTYRLVLAGSPTATTQGLPDAVNWVNTGEGDDGTAGDPLPNGRYTISTAVTAPLVIDFGIDARPATTPLTVATPQLNPGGTINVAVPAGTFGGSDATDLSGGAVKYIHLKSFPTNATSITVTAATTPGGTAGTNTYTAATFPAGGLYVATNTAGNPLTAVSVDPVNNASEVDFTYATVDAAYVESNSTGIARQPLLSLSISGSVFDDYNGSTDALINGVGTNAGGTLYVVALDGTMVAGSATVAADGSYAISGLSAGDYTLLLTTSPSATVAALPPYWVNTGEGSGSGSDGSINGSTAVSLASASVAAINFAVEQLAVADAKSYAVNQFTSPSVLNANIASTLNPAINYDYRIIMTGLASGGNIPGAPSAADGDGNSGSPLTLADGTPNTSLVIDPSSYFGTVNGVSGPDGFVLVYDGVQLHAGGCQGSNTGNSVCGYYNSGNGTWEIPSFDLSKLTILSQRGSTNIAFEYAFRDAAGFVGPTATYQVVFGTPLPVHLISFTGVKRGNTAALSWTVDNETDFRGYAVERSLDGRSFEQVGFVNARNLATLQRYGYNDDLGGIRSARVYYRLRQLDNNGSFTYSNVVNLALDNGAVENAVTVLTNPVKSAVKLQVRSATGGKAQVVLVDAAGRVIASRQQQVPQGTTTFNIEVPGFAANGIYTVVTLLNGERFASKVLLDR
ncbi:hypothetical protein EPD60_06295 [Flaviaesturariibacter flavus]|uniref:T9SS type A sorting domain-containing protein n=1 Tax=Flaviaesturariibacter flavus TaxID=2502780 RepID=A0A4R1BKC9_9BACT|nr:Ig domain-containing protein [Flaviaesturariibacter flavus]TCJ17793.1 hypothetical protein EPD60_06295 [Flaviaesturariibacter flavus]